MTRLISLLFTVVAFELMLGGGGRLTALGPVSLRMILFAAALLTVGIQVIRQQKIPFDYWFISILFGIVLLIGSVRGVFVGALHANLWEDVKPLLYFFMLPFFGFAIQNQNKVELTASIIKNSGIILSCLFIGILISMHTTLLPFLDFFYAVNDSQEFFFRGELTFFYKGFVYICIAFLSVHFSKSPYKNYFLILLGVAIFLSVTRGFLFALALTYAAYNYVKLSYIKSIIFGLLSLVVVTVGQFAIRQSSIALDQIKNQQEAVQLNKITPNTTLLGDKSNSDNGRLQQIREVVAQTDITSILIGHGFGNGIPSRPIHMEISYLEIFHKQGLLGLTFWAYLLWLLYQKYRAGTNGPLSDSFFFGSLFIYFQSLTNQYINNPIGLSMILISLVCLDQLKEIKD